jgi:hypothetical protein
MRTDVELNEKENSSLQFLFSQDHIQIIRDTFSNFFDPKVKFDFFKELFKELGFEL